MEVYEILEFKREKDSWICSECDTENSLLINKCIVCGEMKKSGSKILRAQNKEEKPVTPPEKDNPNPNDDPIFKEHDEYDNHIDATKETNYKGLIWVVAILVIVFLRIIIVHNYYPSDYLAQKKRHIYCKTTS